MVYKRILVLLRNYQVFTKVMTKVENIKNDKFSFKWPKRL